MAELMYRDLPMLWRKLLKDSFYKYLIFCTAWKLWHWLDFVLLVCTFGYYSIIHGSHHQRKYASEHYEKSAQLVRILWRGKYSRVGRHGLSNFIYIHEKFINPDEVLLNDSASLFTFGLTKATFCISSQHDVYDLDVDPFLFNAQFYKAERLVILTNKSLIKLSHRLADPKVNTTMVSMTTRCGSTLIAQMFNKITEIRVMSEPWAFFDLHTLYKQKQLSKAHYINYIRALLKLQLKPHSTGKYKSILLKLCPISTSQCIFFKKFMPHANIFFNTRNITETTLSKYKVGQEAADISGFLLGLHKKYWLDMIGFPDVSADWWEYYELYATDKFKGIDLGELMIMSMLGNIDSFLDTKDIFSGVIFYEDLSRDAEKTLQPMFSQMGLTSNQVSQALQALKRDSQKGLLGQRGTSNTIITEKTWRRMEQICAERNSKIRPRMEFSEYRKVIEG